jgi:hypothetical protein
MPFFFLFGSWNFWVIFQTSIWLEKSQAAKCDVFLFFSELRCGGHAVPCGNDDDDVTGSRGEVPVYSSHTLQLLISLKIFSFLQLCYFSFWSSSSSFFFFFFSLFMFCMFAQIHKVIGGSVADRDGRIQKGDRVLSINGKGLKGVTHREALAILKVI